MKSKKTAIKTAQLIFVCLGLFLSITALLISTPTAVKLAQSKIAIEGNQPWEKPLYLTAETVKQEVVPEASIIDSDVTPPKLSAGAVIALDWDSGNILYQKNIHTRLSPASTTKIMTALVAVEYFKSADVLTVPQKAHVGGASMDLNTGEELSFRSLLYGMLLNSGNDAAYTITLNYPGGFEAFVDTMNEKARQLGLTDTHFTNPAGFDDPNHFTTAADLAKIGQAVAQDAQLAKIVSTKETSVLSWDKSKYHSLKNLNQLLGSDGVLGIKTGYTEQAGENLVGLVERKGHKVLTVVLSSNDRFGETKALMDWIYANYSWR